MIQKDRMIPSAMIVATSFLFGSSYAARKVGLLHMTPFFFNGFRFFVGFLLVLAAWYISRRIARRNPETLEAEEAIWKSMRWQIGGGLLVGLVYCIGAGTQQLALMTIDTGTCGFMTSLYILFIPLFQRIFLHRKIALKVWAGVLLAIFGLFFISAGVNFHISTGHLLLLCTAVCYAAQILLIGHFVRHSDPLLLVAVELFVGSVFSLMIAWIFEPVNTLTDIGLSFWPLLYTSVFSLGLANVLQFVAQKKLAPSLVAIILSFESVFSVLTGAIVLGERMNGLQILGCVLILSAVLIAQYEKKS